MSTAHISTIDCQAAKQDARAAMCSGVGVTRSCVRVGYFIIIAIAASMTAPDVGYGQWHDVKLPRPTHLYNEEYRTWPFLGPMEWVNNDTAYVFERSGIYYKTTNRGQKWVIDSLDTSGLTLGNGFPSPIVGRCDFITSNYGVVSVSAWEGSYYIDSLIYVTEDGGRTWTRKEVSLPGMDRYLGVGTKIIPLANGEMVGCYGSSVFDTVSNKYVVLEIVSKSFDTGTTWQVESVDTLVRNVDVAFTTEWIRVDSLTIYKFTWQGLGDVYTSYVKYTYDGGATWRILNKPSMIEHPLHISKIGARKHQNIKMLNDTGVVVCMGYGKKGLPGFGMVTRDMKHHSEADGWIRINADEVQNGNIIVDAGFVDNKAYYLSSRGDDRDTLWIVNMENQGVRQGIPSPNLRGLSGEAAHLHIASEKDVFLWRKVGISKLDESILNVESRIHDEKEVKLGYYPTPMTSNREGVLSFSVPKAYVGNRFSIMLYNVMGGRLAETVGNIVEERTMLPLNSMMRGDINKGIYLLVLEIADRCCYFIKIQKL